MSVVEELEVAARTVSAAAESAVVRLGQDGRGSGFVVADGKVLTNAHNLRNPTIQVAFANGTVTQVTNDLDLVVQGVNGSGLVTANEDIITDIQEIERMIDPNNDGVSPDELQAFLAGL